MWICAHFKYVEMIPKVKTSQKTIPKVKKSVSRNPTEMIPKVKNQSREIPPRW
jgi:hypothetical protein